MKEVRTGKQIQTEIITAMHYQHTGDYSVLAETRQPDGRTVDRDEFVDTLIQMVIARYRGTRKDCTADESDEFFTWVVGALNSYSMTDSEVYCVLIFILALDHLA